MTEDLLLSQEEFDVLPEYSCTIPTGAIVGKRWKRREPYGATKNATWYVGEYVELTPPDPKKIGIKWIKVHVGEEFPWKRNLS